MQRYYNFFRKAKNSQKYTCSCPDRFYLAFVFHQASQSYIVFLKYATITRNNQLFVGEKTLVLCRCRTSLKAIAPKYHPFASHPCQPKNGTYLGLTWDLLGTHLPMRAYGIVKCDSPWTAMQSYCFTKNWSTVLSIKELLQKNDILLSVNC